MKSSSMTSSFMKSRFATQRSMTQCCACVLGVLLVASVAAQVAGSPAAKPAGRAMIEGMVIKEPGSEPVKKVLIELIAENQAEGGDYTAVSGADGSFHIEGIVPGRYHMFAERTGLLEVDKHRARSDGRVLVLTAGQEVKDLRIQVQAAAVVRGRVTDEDGDPLPNAQVAVLRQTFVSGRSRWEQAGAERTNDLGEYRVAGLPAGSYYVSVSPPPDFKSLIEAAGGAAQSRAAKCGPTNLRPRRIRRRTIPVPRTAARLHLFSCMRATILRSTFSLTPESEPEYSRVGGEFAGAVVGGDHAAVARFQPGAEWRGDASRRQLCDSRRGAGSVHDSGDDGERAGADDGAASAATGRRTAWKICDCSRSREDGFMGGCVWKAKAAGRSGTRWMRARFF